MNQTLYSSTIFVPSVSVAAEIVGKSLLNPTRSRTLCSMRTQVHISRYKAFTVAVQNGMHLAYEMAL